MTKAVLTKEELFISINDTVAKLVQLISSLDESEINKIPYEDSWTAGQVLRHITKSTNGMAKAMQASSKAAERDPAENVPHLKKTFLDFLHKMKSPEFIIPEEEICTRQTSVEELTQSFEKLKEHSNKAKLDDLVEGLPFGPTTKLELLHFVLYHTERHLHQLKKIAEAVKQ